MAEQKLITKRNKSIRIFNPQGIELYEEDLKYLKNCDALIISQGEDFNQDSFFGQYKRIKELGQGGFGKVYLGEHKQTKQLAAIKLLDPHSIGNSMDVDLVFKEGTILKHLEHKNIVKIFNCYTLSNGQVVLIMEYICGGELARYVQLKEKLEEQEARFIFQQIAEAINYCHR